MKTIGRCKEKGWKNTLKPICVRGLKAQRKGNLKYIGNEKRVCQKFYSAHPLISLYNKTVLRRSKQQLFAKSWCGSLLFQEGLLTICEPSHQQFCP